MEGYHATQTHPQLLARAVKQGYGGGTDTVGFTDPDDVVGSSIYFMKVLSEGMGGGMIHAKDIAVAEDLKNMELPADGCTRSSPGIRGSTTRSSAEARRPGIAMPDLNQRRRDGPRLVGQLRLPALLPVAGLRQRRGLSRPARSAPRRPSSRSGRRR